MLTTSASIYPTPKEGKNNLYKKGLYNSAENDNNPQMY